MGIEIRRAGAQDVPELMSLWRVCFPGDESFCDFFFERMYSHDCARLAVVDGELAGALYVFPYSFSRGETAWYIYGVGTHPHMRGKGVAGALIEHVLHEARTKGLDLCMLVPQDAGLFEFYKKFGFRPSFFLEEREHVSSGGGAGVRRGGKGDIDRLDGIYQSSLAGRAHIRRTRREWELIMDEFESVGAVYVLEEGQMCAYAACAKDGQGLTVREVLGKDISALMDGVAGDARLKYYLPGGSSAYGSACPLSAAGEGLLEESAQVYMNLMHS